MKRQLSLIFLSLLLSVCSCQKTSVSPTQAQLTAQKLTGLLGSSGTFAGGRVIYVNNNTGSLVYTATSFNISSDGFITLSASGQYTQTFNLAFLTNYTVYNVGTDNVELDFSF